VWINVVGVADGSIGLNGKATTAAGVVNYMTEEYRAAPRVPVEVPDGVVIDPICGMRVRLGPRAITLDHDGTTVGFCATGCRDAYAENEGSSRTSADPRHQHRAGRFRRAARAVRGAALRPRQSRGLFMMRGMHGGGHGHEQDSDERSGSDDQTGVR
jgi:YHS domain-containing protein